MHERECPYRPVACPNGCEAHLLENNLQSHLKICSNALVRCDLECGVSIKRHEHAKHQANHCPNFVTECCVDDCRTKVLRWRLQDHMNKHVSELHHSANENAANLRRAMTSVAQRFGKVNHSTNEMRLQHDLSDIALNEFWERRSTIQGFSTPMSPFVATVYLLSTWYLDIVSYQTGFLIVAMIVIFELKMRDTWKTLVAASTAKSIPMQIQSFREHVEKGERYTSALFIADGYQCQLEVVAVVAAKGKGTDRRLVVRLNVFSADIDDWLVWPPKFSASLSVLGANGAKSRFPLVMASGPNNWQPTPKSVPRGSFRTTLGTAQTLMKKGLVVKDTLLGVCHIASHT
ncbi:hypothetical protein SARC_02438 [Sphaeroforma arctica JP610]|uniref:TRAF-type domain-containing protein n=1 Tax=Sphaeroforma arctica JP610 TaxID=667725 RepID=A0A0L0G8P4_9EUKA|nr:hypothetical protein SARC_02438 [Sphaeroforma arctica JP610]KNC85380.1 hypothetical protein SARC_02438 [Sphaeroforma arctica JP610]|eukprot:XP_014159282.1 hypothetical protein SARC_02438 [Sphaeroforma arctica JP610]